MRKMSEKPKWTVVYNIVSKESNKWIGTGWEFFDDEIDASSCYARQVKAGNTPTKRPYYDKSDRKHLGAVHQALRKSGEKDE